MPFYKDQENKVHFIDSVDFEHLLPSGVVPISTGEAQVLQSPPEPTTEQVKSLRQAAYSAESDPLFFKFQRGEVAQTEWLQKVDEIRVRYPV